ncbi:carboxylic acid reductase [Nocardia stercoris]|uniref:Carboxylic acid reductase n=1 Tax=Nocardia stercoris TaxID=2483361 RepID=A0A3M2LDY9_9NOCA|nr:carboxylic acid reductase [Nocardia stercoris]RMI34823.1 NAD-dependent epimerase/dehydratase family protein [Nocardia stercoris]
MAEQAQLDADRSGITMGPSPQVTAAIRQPGMRLCRIIDTIMTGYADRPALGVRATEVVTDQGGRRVRRPLPAYDIVTYGELWAQAGRIAAAWRDDPQPVRAGDFVALVGSTGADLYTAELAAVRLGAVTVPLQAGAPPQQWTEIMADIEPQLVATGVELLDSVVDAVRAGFRPPHLVVLGAHADDDTHLAAVAAARERLADSPITVSLLQTDDERGVSLPAPEVPVPGVRADSLAQLLYTSGSTGTPKGVMYTDELMCGQWLAPLVFDPGDERTGPVRTLSYLPLSHLAGRGQLVSALVNGGSCMFAASSDMSSLFEDFELTRPTVIMFVPRVCELIHQMFHSRVDGLLATGIDRAVAEEQVRTELRTQTLGGRLDYVVCGAAPLSAAMRTFMESVLGLPLHDGYGSTEAGGVLADNVIKRPQVIDYKLADVPELGYFGTDRPYPRGELLVKTENMFAGYYRRPDITAEVFDSDGYFRTGDVMAQVGPDRLVYVDRRNNVLKLSQGEFVAVAQLEALYGTSPLIRQIYVYGSSARSAVLAVVVPTDAARSGDPKQAIAAELQRVAREAERPPYEIPRDFLIETEPFTRENGLLSGVGKLARPQLKAKYAERLEQLYEAMETQQAGELSTLRRDGAGLPPLETVRRAAAALLGADGAEVSPQARFGDLGGDSLSALSLSTLLEEIYGVSVPVGDIVSPAVDLRGLADHVERAMTSGGGPTARSVHGSGPLQAADLTLDKFIDALTLVAAHSIPAATSPPRTVLLTGANGYLGRFLCLEWLDRLDAVGGQLVCIVRGRDAADARSRLDAAFDSGDATLLARYRGLAGRRLRVLAGDIGEPELGLPQEQWRELAGQVDLIVHPAALVNHVLPYDQLFGPNVAGTAELIRLALTERRKPVTYLSSVGVASQTDPADFDENADVRTMIPRWRLGDDYANGYSGSKWAGEVLLREANEQYGLPVTVFRSDMILAHSYYAGQLNVPDAFTRLILSVLATHLAPKSFYRLDSLGQRQRSHYDGLPADFTAAAITKLGAGTTAGDTTFDVFNPHDDGLSLDQFVDWLIEAGHPIERIDDYPDWFAKFEAALHELPEWQAKASVLPLLHAYRDPAEPRCGSELPTANFRAAVERSGSGIPHLNRALIDKYVSDLRLLQLL